MFKYLWIFATMLWGMQLSAETVGNIEFQFPPSNYDWKLFFDEEFFNGAVSDQDEDDDFSIIEENHYFKFFTHREGDALEIFFAVQSPVDEGDEDEEMDTLFTAQKEIDETLNQYLPNHRLVLLNWKELEHEGFAEWEFNDGQLDVMHGYARYFKKGDDVCILFYLTTALRTEYNRAVWTQMLNNAR